MNKCALMAVAGFCLLIAAGNAAMAQSTPRVKVELKQVEPDAAANEKSRLEVYVDGILSQVSVEYKDEQVRVQEFRPDGTLKAETETLAGKRGVKLTVYQDDGKGLSRVEIISPSGLESLQYRDDGKTLWTKTVRGLQGRQAEYYDASGKLRLRREFPRRGLKMNVTVFDTSGDAAYKQVWTLGIAGYVLESIEETSASGEQRRVILLGKRIVQVEYLGADGTVERTEAGDALSEPVAAERLQELAADDDPTVPRRLIKRNRAPNKQTP